MGKTVHGALNHSDFSFTGEERAGEAAAENWAVRTGAADAAAGAAAAG